MTPWAPKNPGFSPEISPATRDITSRPDVAAASPRRCRVRRARGHGPPPRTRWRPARHRGSRFPPQVDTRGSTQFCGVCWVGNQHVCYCMFVYLIGDLLWFTDSLIAWLIDLIDSIEWSTDWLIDWLVGWLVGCLIVYFNWLRKLIDWLGWMDLLIDLLLYL